ncbi:MAG: helix-turn-helix transcriptional regulator [Bryobacterales bacterium]|nr:helix-turn-helix transcriptional regulator [Bryobacterales bacterium]
MAFEQLLEKLLQHVRLRVRNGQLTERGLARLAGISQPHIHHILSGKRGLSPANADRLLAALSIDIADLLGEEPGVLAAVASENDSSRWPGRIEPPLLVPMLDGLIGPGFPAPLPMARPKYLPVPPREIPRNCVLYAARLAYDPSLEPLLLSDDLVVIALKPLPETMQSEIDDLLQVRESAGSWLVRNPREDGRLPAQLADPQPKATAAANPSTCVGVVALCIRRLRPLRLPLSSERPGI